MNIDYTLCEQQLADALAADLSNDRTAVATMVRVLDVDHGNLDYQRIAQIMQDTLREDVSWREIPQMELVLYSDENLNGDHLIIFKCDQREVNDDSVS